MNLEVFNACYVPGVSNPSVIGGLAAEEGIEIMELLGSSKKIKSIMFYNFNPTIEDYRTGRYLAYLIGFFIKNSLVN